MIGKAKERIDCSEIENKEQALSFIKELLKIEVATRPGDDLVLALTEVSCEGGRLHSGPRSVGRRDG